MGSPRIDRNDKFAVLWDFEGPLVVAGYGPTEQSAWRDAAHGFYCYHATKPQFAKYDATVMGTSKFRKICEKEKIFLKLAKF